MEVISGKICRVVKIPEGDKLFSNNLNTRVNPYVCEDCGYAKWYVKEPENLIKK